MKQTWDILGFDDRLMRLIGIPLLAFLIPVFFFGENLPSSLAVYWPKFLVSLFYVFVYWEISRWLLIYFRRKYPLPEMTKRRLFVSGSVTIVFVLTFCNLTEVVFLPFEAIVEHHPDPVMANVVSLFMVILCVSVYESVYFFSKLKLSLLEAEQLKRANVQAQLDTLKSQVNPHFLFNSLNTLSSIIPEDQPKAVDFVQKLSKVYRYILEIRDQEAISLEEELECLDAYCFLLKSRFGENIMIDIDIDPALYQNRIVPLTLQILLENAVKHNIISRAKPLKVEIFNEKNSLLIIRNNLQIKDQVIHSTKTGLQNIKDRYRLLSDKDVKIMVTDKYFTVSVPIIEVHEYESSDY